MIPKSALDTDEAKRELDKIKEVEKTVDREKLVCIANEYTCNFKNFRKIRTLGRDVHEGKITLEEAGVDQTNLLNDIRNFKNNTRPQNDKKKQEKEVVLKNLHNFSEAREIFLNGFESRISLIKSKGSGHLNTDHSKLQILAPKQMLRRLPIALSQVKAANNSEIY